MSTGNILLNKTIPYNIRILSEMWYEKFNASALINDTWYITDVPSIVDSQLCLAENVVSLNNQSYKMRSYYFKRYI